MRGFIRKRLELLKEQGLYRSLKPFQGEQGPWVELSGKRVLNLCSNNYLGLAAHPKVKEAVARAAYEYGCGSGGSRLICGSMELHQTLERRLAAFKKTESALLYGSGYTANLGVISSLVGKGDLIFSDELNHASIIDGCRQSQAKVIVFPHNDMIALEGHLHRAYNTNRERCRLIAVDGIFSMDGDLAPLPELAKLAERYESMLMVDEAHATGTLGPGGRGAVAYFDLEDNAFVLTGTLSKALGNFGAFVAGGQELKEFLINTSRSFIFTTALPPTVVASSLAALDILEQEPHLVEKLQDNARYLREGLKRLGYNTMNSQTQIIPVLIGEPARTLKMSQSLLEKGILAIAIRPPTVREGTSRIRLSVMANHSLGDLDFALEVFEEAGRDLERT